VGQRRGIRGRHPASPYVLLEKNPASPCAAADLTNDIGSGMCFQPGQRRASSQGRYNTPVRITLRDFRPDDLERLWSIDQQCFPEGIAYSRAELTAYIQLRTACTIVAEGRRGGEPVPEILGFLIAHHSRRGVGHIITIDVLGEARRQKIGSLLLAEAERRLRAVSCHCLVLETAVDNSAALAFYKRHQYFVIRTVPHYYSNGVDALVLQKDLQKDLLSHPQAG